MSVTSQTRQAPATSRTSVGTRPQGRLAGSLAPLGDALRGRARTVRHALERPLTSYYLLLGGTTMLLAIGLMMVLSASSVYSFKAHDSSYYIFLKQLTWVAIGLPAAFVASRFNRRLLRLLAWPAVIIAVVLLALTQTSLGFAVNGNRNWLDLGGLTLQPSEIAKLAIVLWTADVYATKEKLLGNPVQALVPVAPVIVMISALVVFQHDLGTALVLFALLLGMLWVVGVPARLFGFAFSVVGVLAFYLAASNSERRERLTSFMDPFKDFQGSGWQAGHGLLGMASGGIFGKGLSASQQKWGSLPEAHTDFIFAVLGEELGLVGTLLVLVLFGAVAYAAVRLAITTADPFVRYATAGVTIWLMSQMLINIGMVLALLPVIGIPLPLVSYGGSALVPSLVALGLLVGFARNEPEARAALQARRRDRGQGGTGGQGGRTRRPGTAVPAVLAGSLRSRSRRQ
ncbi:cell division-specific peptidoglycan biosynthesis regulator FtsW [Nocardioides scoriae]|uniref:Probable peptidoglycan glycosyltransferase FtsW n=1 Tax=Nocardioides scoriae TaxID=642780 RepID=A0A1H1L7P4_9ACTN|nr:putative lipid II flippase FtsW [Nocardioides scoriae]SDR70503.1 cell division-specific peptidoglycan biosynthesis regulator FtsW [Nocardioides scoriae]